MERKCTCGYLLKKPHHILCYKCHTLKQKFGEAKWLKRRRDMSYRWKLYRRKLKWYKRYSEEIPMKGYQICEIQPAIWNNYQGAVNTCPYPCNGDC